MIVKLIGKLHRNMENYIKEIEQCSPFELFERAEQIYATKRVYQLLLNNKFPDEALSYLDRFVNPLEVVRDQWVASNNISQDESL